MSAGSANPGRGQLDGATATVMYTSWRRCFEMGSAVRTESSKEPSISADTISCVAHIRQGEKKQYAARPPSTKSSTVGRQGRESTACQDTQSSRSDAMASCVPPRQKW